MFDRLNKAHDDSHRIVWRHEEGASVRIVYATECYLVEMDSYDDRGWVVVSLPVIDINSGIAIANAYAADGQA